ncbi:MAG: PTS glucose transporter subunit IIA, partial [Eubacterium sp.]|nr:PTS glucose transporter subunit IIA [Eubacterium sp.]
DGIECIVHIGLDTVNLNGEGFQPLIRQGDKVKAGQPIVNFEREALQQKGYNLTTMVVFPSGYDQKFELGQRTVAAGEKLV